MKESLTTAAAVPAGASITDIATRRKPPRKPPRRTTGGTPPPPISARRTRPDTALYAMGGLEELSAISRKLGDAAVNLRTMLVALASGGDQVTCSLVRLAALTGRSKSTVARWLCAMEDAGLHHVSREQTAYDDSEVNLYTLLPVPHSWIAGSDAQKMVDRARAAAAARGSEGGGFNFVPPRSDEGEGGGFRIEPPSTEVKHSADPDVEGKSNHPTPDDHQTRACDPRGTESGPGHDGRVGVQNLDRKPQIERAAPAASRAPAPPPRKASSRRPVTGWSCPEHRGPAVECVHPDGRHYAAGVACSAYLHAGSCKQTCAMVLCEATGEYVPVAPGVCVECGTTDPDERYTDSEQGYVCWTCCDAAETAEEGMQA